MSSWNILRFPEIRNLSGPGFSFSLEMPRMSDIATLSNFVSADKIGYK